MDKYLKNLRKYLKTNSREEAALYFGLSLETINRYVRKLNSFNNRLVIRKHKSVLIIPDLHAPFIRKGYLDFCKEMYSKWNCEDVFFLGDLIDNHYSSYHESDPDGLSALQELIEAKKQIQDFYYTFPKAKVCLGNHDAIPDRKNFTAGVSKVWVKKIGEVLDTPNWEYDESFTYNNILICHGLGRKAHTRMKQDMVSVIQGHYHSESSIIYQVGRDRKTFAMQLGCGMDNNSYAMAYAKHFMRQHINVGILINGETPLIEYMGL